MEFCSQTIDFSGTGMHHHNGVAEQAVQRIAYWAHTMRLHLVLQWHLSTDWELCPFAFMHCEIICHVIHCLLLQMNLPRMIHCCVIMYLLLLWYAQLQDEKRSPKWTPMSCIGKFLGYSPHHATLVGDILKIITGCLNFIQYMMTSSQHNWRPITLVVHNKKFRCNPKSTIPKFTYLVYRSRWYLFSLWFVEK